MATMQNIIDSARVILQDSTKVRFSDTELLAHANVAVMEAYRLRPDLFFSSISAPPTALVAGGTFPLPTYLEDAVAQFAAGRTELRGDLYSKEGRAPSLMAALKGALMGV